MGHYRRVAQSICLKEMRVSIFNAESAKLRLATAGPLPLGATYTELWSIKPSRDPKFAFRDSLDTLLAYLMGPPTCEANPDDTPPLPRLCVRKGRGEGTTNSHDSRPLTLTLSPEYKGEGTRILLKPVPLICGDFMRVANNGPHIRTMDTNAGHEPLAIG